MNPDEKALFKTITSLIDDKEYLKAENELNLITSAETFSEEAISHAYYLIGYINTCWDNKDKNKHRAKRMLLTCIRSDYPIPYAYYLYADQEEDKTIACNYLNAGLEKFSDNPDIYLGIIRHCPKDETIKYINEIDKKNIVDINLLNKVIEILISISNWEKVETFLEKLLKRTDLSEYNSLYYKMLYSFSLVEQDKDIEKARDLFLDIIEIDLSNRLNYSPYMGYIWCCIKTNISEEIIKYFDKIPLSNGLEDLNDGPWSIICIDFIDIYKLVFKEIENIIRDDKKRMLRLAAMEAYYLYKPSEFFAIYRYSKKHLSALKRYLKTDVNNLDVACIVFRMQEHFCLFFDAYKTYIEMLCEYLKPDEKYVFGIDFFDQSSPEENELIYQDILSVLKTYNLDYDRFVSGIFDNMINYLYKSDIKKKYEKICAISNNLEDRFLEKSKKLFEVAYSYAVLEDTSRKAEKFYLHILKKQPNNSAVLNNLGVIYERRNEIQKAKEYFERSYELDSCDEKCTRNLERVSFIIKENEKALNNIQKENAWFLGRLQMVYDLATSDGKLECTYRSRPSILHVDPKRADEIFDRMCECRYLTKESGNSQTPNKYIINPLIREYLWKQNERIEENKLYQALGEKLNIDEIKKIGYTENLQDLINNITNTDLREILQRDIKECAISLLTNQYKSSIVICGSIIEAILVDRIVDRGISKYDIGTLLNNKEKTKAVKEMDLNELIELAKAEKIIKIEDYHLSNYVRFYRNIIHPSCEVRKNYEVDEDKAKLMWSVLLER